MLELVVDGRWLGRQLVVDERGQCVVRVKVGQAGEFRWAKEVRIYLQWLS